MAAEPVAEAAQPRIDADDDSARGSTKDWRRGMSMHSGTPEGVQRDSEEIPDPNQIPFGLRRKRRAWPHAAWTKEIHRDVTLGSMRYEQMHREGIRRRSLAPGLRASTSIQSASVVDARRLRPDTTCPPFATEIVEMPITYSGVDEVGLHDALRCVSNTLRSVVDSATTPAVGAAIDIIAEKDKRAPPRMRARGDVGGYLLQQVSQQVEPADDIADCVEELTLWQRRMVEA